MLPTSGFDMLIPIIAIKTARMILTQAIGVSLGLLLPCERVGGHTKVGQIADFLERSWQSEEEAYNHSSNSEDDCAGSMACQSVHGNGKCQYMCTTDEDQDQD
jgi:hypothetical protein